MDWAWIVVGVCMAGILYGIQCRKKLGKPGSEQRPAVTDEQAGSAPEPLITRVETRPRPGIFIFRSNYTVTTPLMALLLDGRQVESAFERSRMLDETTMRISYMASAWERAQQVKDARPYGRYVAVQDQRTRQEHKAWHGMIVPLDDPWWDTHWPPNGWGCRCTVETVSDYDLRTIYTSESVTRPPPDQPFTVNLRGPDGPVPVQTVAGIEPGWAYNPGKAAQGTRIPDAARQAPGGDAYESLPKIEGGTWVSANSPSTYRWCEMDAELIADEQAMQDFKMFLVALRTQFEADGTPAEKLTRMKELENAPAFGDWYGRTKNYYAYKSEKFPEIVLWRDFAQRFDCNAPQAASLIEAGYDSLEAVANAEPAAIKKLPKFGPKSAPVTINAARRRLDLPPLEL